MHAKTVQNRQSFTKKIAAAAVFSFFSLAVFAPIAKTQAAPVQLVFVPIPDQSVAVGQNLTFGVQAVRQDGSALTYIAYSADLLPGATFDAITNTYSWTPTAEDLGNHIITVYSSDGYYGIRMDVNITVTPAVIVDPIPVPEPPVLQAISDIAVISGDNATFTAAATSPSGLTITYGAALFDGMTINKATGVFTFNTINQSIGDYSVTVTASDGVNAPVQTHVNISVLPAPIAFSGISNQSVTVGQTLNFTANVTNPSGLPLSFVADQLGNATFDANTGAYTWTPSVQDIGNYTINLYATDGYNNINTAVDITVVAAAPQVIEPPVMQTISDIAVTLGETATFTAIATSPSGLPITYGADLLTGMTIDSATGVFNFNTSNQTAGTYAVVVTASDGTNAPVQTIANITVNAAPIPDPTPIPDPIPVPDPIPTPDPTPDPKIETASKKHDSKRTSSEYSSKKNDSQKNSSKEIKKSSDSRSKKYSSKQN